MSPSPRALHSPHLPTSGATRAARLSQPAGGTCLKFVEQQLEDLRGGHGAVDADIGDGAVGRGKHRRLPTEGSSSGWEWGQGQGLKPRKPTPFPGVGGTGMLTLKLCFRTAPE